MLQLPLPKRKSHYGTDGFSSEVGGDGGGDLSIAGTSSAAAPAAGESAGGRSSTGAAGTRMGEAADRASMASAIAARTLGGNSMAASTAATASGGAK